MPALSVLDLIPVRSAQTSGQAINASVELARVADDAGYARYWVAEHHNMPAVASTHPATLIALLASATERMRVGSGGVMLPNHAPLSVAEQFAVLEARFPGRIDLGIGRAPGTDPLTSAALRGSQFTPAEFPEHVAQVIEFLQPEGGLVEVAGRGARLRSTPAGVSAPPVWLLGSSGYSAQLAASMGLGYVFAHHFSGRGTGEALALYRSGFRGERPQAMITANVCVAETTERAEELALPFRHAMLWLATGAPLRRQLTIEEATQAPVSDPALFAAMSRPWFIGTPDAVRAGLEELAHTHGVDEIMVQPVAGSSESDPIDRAPNREDTLRLLAG